jgi:hypothetical protein
MASFGPGKIILFSEGEYSDFGYCGHVVTLCEIDMKEAVAEYKAVYRPKNDWDSPEPDGFVAWLCAQQKVAEINAEVIHLGEYGRLSDNPA